MKAVLLALVAVTVGCRTQAPPTPPAQAPAVGHRVAIHGMQEVVIETLDKLEWDRWLTFESRGYAFVARIVRQVVAQDLVTPGQRQRIRDAAGPAPVKHSPAR